MSARASTPTPVDDGGKPRTTSPDDKLGVSDISLSLETHDGRSPVELKPRRDKGVMKNTCPGVKEEHRPSPADEGGVDHGPDGLASSPSDSSDSSHGSTIPAISFTGDTPSTAVKKDVTLTKLVAAATSPSETGDVSKATSISRSDVPSIVHSSARSKLGN